MGWCCGGTCIAWVSGSFYVLLLGRQNIKLCSTFAKEDCKKGEPSMGSLRRLKCRIEVIDGNAEHFATIDSLHVSFRLVQCVWSQGEYTWARCLTSRVGADK